MKYADVILPLPLDGFFTYSLSNDLSAMAKVGCRVVVPFGAGKLQTGIIAALRDSADAAKDIEIKEVVELIDEKPMLGEKELRLWRWIADYYMCSVGEVMKAALPSGMKLSSETAIRLIADFDKWDELTRHETEMLELLQNKRCKTVAALQKAAGRSVMKTMRSLMHKGALEVSETLVESAKPKKEVHVRLHPKFLDEKALNDLLDSLQKTPRRYELVIRLVELSGVAAAIKLRNKQLVEEVSRRKLLRDTNASAAVLLSLKAKGIIELYEYEVSRLRKAKNSIAEQLPLSEEQQNALNQIKRQLRGKRVCLLDGVTSSGKTEIYIRLIREVLDSGKQVLYMLPEIALTTQITQRLYRVFGDEMGVYHSKFPDAERVEIWRKQVSEKPFKLIVGVRSSLFLPQRDIGLIIVDEEHESSYKQQDPAPRYHARDAAIMLAQMQNAKVLLGTATPAIETFHNASTGKFGYVRLDKRYGGILMPEVEVVNVRDLERRKLMHHPFSPRLEEEMRQAFANGEQVILFQNRRGYAPVVECLACGWVPRCEYCDVSLTFHQQDGKLHCHYCGNSFAVPVKCPNCGGHDLRSHGYGTEKVEEEVRKRFPSVRTARLDLDTTRSRKSYRTIIDDFSEGKSDVLIGTQMISKGLDFGNVRVVGIIDADTMLMRPDFRCHERAFQMMSQVAGRAGRRGKRGRVILQTRRADSGIIAQVVEGNYAKMYEEQLAERRQFYYPPFYRIIYVWLKHRNEPTVNEAAHLVARRVQESFGGGVLGPDKPVVSRVQMLHLRRVVLKIAPRLPIAEVRLRLRSSVNGALAAPHLRSVSVYFDVDPL